MLRETPKNHLLGGLHEYRSVVRESPGDTGLRAGSESFAFQAAACGRYGIDLTSTMKWNTPEGVPSRYRWSLVADSPIALPVAFVVYRGSVWPSRTIWVRCPAGGEAPR